MWGSPHLCRDPRKGLSSSHPLPRHRTALSATCDHPPTARTDLPENPLLLELILKPLTHQSPLVPMGAAHSVLAPPPLAPLASTLEIPWRNQGCQTPGTHIRGAPPGPGTPGIFTQHICRTAFPCQGHPRFWDARLCWLFCCPPPSPPTPFPLCSNLCRHLPRVPGPLPPNDQPGGASRQRESRRRVWACRLPPSLTAVGSGGAPL